MMASKNLGTGSTSQITEKDLKPGVEIVIRQLEGGLRWDIELDTKVE